VPPRREESAVGFVVRMPFCRLFCLQGHELDTVPWKIRMATLKLDAATFNPCAPKRASHFELND